MYCLRALCVEARPLFAQTLNAAVILAYYRTASTLAPSEGEGMAL